MVFSSLIYTLQRSSFIKNLLQQLEVESKIGIKGLNRLSKGLISSICIRFSKTLDGSLSKKRIMAIKKE